MNIYNKYKYYIIILNILYSNIIINILNIFKKYFIILNILFINILLLLNKYN